MNDASDFQTVRSSTFRSLSYLYRFLHEQRHQCGTGFGHLSSPYAFLGLAKKIKNAYLSLPLEDCHAHTSAGFNCQSRG